MSSIDQPTNYNPQESLIAAHEKFLNVVPQSVRDLLAAEIPVVVCKPRPGWKPGDPGSDLIFPEGWQTITYEECLEGLLAYRPGVDALAMVAGHGVDVVDLDSKMGASLDDLPVFRNYGVVRTPSGGWHLYVPSTGYGKLSPLIVNGKTVGDYCGGTHDGGSRMLVFLPGSVRPKYPNETYVEETPIDVNALLDSEPDPMLITMLEAAGATSVGAAGKAMADPPLLKAFLAEHEYQPGHHQCQYGRAAMNGMLSEVEQFTPNGGIQGRHGWATRSCTRLVELMRAGCATTQDYREIEATLQRIKPEGGSDITSIMRWALSNATGDSGCTEHGPSNLTTWEPGDAVRGSVTPTQATADRVSPLFPEVDWEALFADTTEDVWLQEPLIPKGRLVAIYSAAKVGKSMLLLEACVKLSTGQDFLGYPNTCGPTDVLYVDFENDIKGDIRERLQQMEVKPADLKKLHYLSFPNLSSLDTPAGGRELLQAARDFNAQVVVIDTVSRTISGAENDNDTFLQWYRHTGRLLKQEGIACLRADHSGKDHSKGQRGGSAKSGDVDCVWQLKKLSDDTLELRLDVSRFRISESLITLRREQDPLRHVVDQRGYQRVRETDLDNVIAFLDARNFPTEGDGSGLRQARDLVKSQGPLGADGKAIRSRVVEDAQRQRKERLTTTCFEPYLTGSIDDQPSQNACDGWE